MDYQLSHATITVFVLGGYVIMLPKRGVSPKTWGETGEPDGDFITVRSTDSSGGR